MEQPDNDYDASVDVPRINQLLIDCLNKRQNAYLEELGGWQQQLDMIYNDINAWRAAVQSIKNRYPKPE
jgi:hypothetical protein